MTTQELEQFKKDATAHCETDWVFARIVDDSVYIEEWMRHKTGADNIINKYGQNSQYKFKIKWIERLHYLDIPTI